MTNSESANSEVNDRRAIAQVSFAYVWWGGSAIFWSQLGSVAPLDQLSFRIVTAFFYLVIGVGLLRKRFVANGVEVALFEPGSLRSKVTAKHLSYGSLAALAIGANWALFLWAVSNGQAVEAAFGYFLMPLMSVALGVGLLGEKLRRLQVLALGFSAVGIVWTIVVLGRLPWVAILVAASFAIYGFLRKQGPWDAVSGLTFETGLLAPVAIVVLVVRSITPNAVLGDGSFITLILIAVTGVVTAVPLLAFASAARRVSLTAVGLLQYINPTLQFLVGWQVLGETVSGGRLAGFAWIWIALMLIVIDEVSSSGGLQRPVDRVETHRGQGLVGPGERLAAEEAAVRRER